MSMHDIVSFVTRKIGMDPKSIGYETIENSINRRIRVCGLDRSNDYLAMLYSSSEEVDALIDEVTVGETWFFRESSAFQALGRFFKQSRDKNYLSIASMPCSSGEEVYSIAVQAMGSGLGKERFHVDGFDINRDALAKAKAAVYGKDSFRGQSYGFVDKYFHRMDEEYAVAPEVKANTCFYYENLLAPGFKSGNRYDIIFCRNFMIYLDRGDRARLLECVVKMLNPGGMFVVAQCEAAYVKGAGFVNYFDEISVSFARDKQVKAASPHRPKVVQKKVLPPIAQPKRLVNSSATTIAVSRKETVDDIKKDSQLYEEIESLIARGDLDNAEKVCSEAMATHTYDPGYLFLFGLVKQLKKCDEEAVSLFRKVLYLNPSHQDALLHCSISYQNLSNREKADGMIRRLKRVVSH